MRQGLESVSQVFQDALAHGEVESASEREAWSLGVRVRVRAVVRVSESRGDSLGEGPNEEDSEG